MTQKKIYALGFFDGVHRGHQALLESCRRLAGTKSAVPAAITFGTHPDQLVMGKAPEMLNTLQDRVTLLKERGMESVTVLPFDRRLMTMPWQDFLRLLLEEYDAGGIVCGNDFSFGYRGEGNAEKMHTACARLGIPCHVVPEQTVDGIRVSSTYIRQLLEQGDMDRAVKFLGHPHILTGSVVQGQHLGRTIGIPTANLVLPENLLVPRYGVYACEAAIDGKIYPAVTNVGTRPTVSGQGVTVEPWILDFDGDLYGKEIRLSFYHFLRAERKFDSLEDLQKEIRKNALQTREFFGEK